MQTPVDIFLKHPDALLPKYETPGSCAFDIATVENAEIQPGEVIRLKTGLVFCVPDNMVLIIAARSSLSKRYGLCLPHGIGIVDYDYCGPDDEFLLQLTNFTNKPTQVKKGDRLAQGMLIPIVKAEFKIVTELKNLSRGGFGSTG